VERSPWRPSDRPAEGRKERGRLWGRRNGCHQGFQADRVCVCCQVLRHAHELDAQGEAGGSGAKGRGVGAGGARKPRSMFDVSDSDMADPELLAQLQELGWTEEDDAKKGRKKAAAAPAAAPGSSTAGGAAGGSPGASPSKRAELEAEILAHKKVAMRTRMGLTLFGGSNLFWVAHFWKLTLHKNLIFFHGQPCALGKFSLFKWLLIRWKLGAGKIILWVLLCNPGLPLLHGNDSGYLCVKCWHLAPRSTSRSSNPSMPWQVSLSPLISDVRFPLIMGGDASIWLWSQTLH
jgi:hypothetical protein